MCNTPFIFHEPFISYNEKCLPNNVYAEENSIYTHHHVRTENRSFYITCRGNNFFCKTPRLKTFKADISLGFRNVEGNAGFQIIFGYDKTYRTGYILDLYLSGNENVKAELLSVCRQVTKSIAQKTFKIQELSEIFKISVSCNGQKLEAFFADNEICFDLPEDYAAGLVGVSFTGHVGELAVHDICVSSDDKLCKTILSEEKTVSIPLRNGGNIPYRLTYSIERTEDVSYLRYSLCGGPQDRKLTPEYPRDTDQYCVEEAFIETPFIGLYKSDRTRIGKYNIYEGTFAVTDPGLHWGILRKHFNVVDLPMTGIIALDDFNSLDDIEISFGYKSITVNGYRMQNECDVEFIFDFATGELKYEGKTIGLEHIEISSFSQKTLDMVPETVYDYDAVVKHLKSNHFFDNSECPNFNVIVETEKNRDFISVKGDLLDVYGDFIKEIPFTATECGYVFSTEPLPVGVYRFVVSVIFGTEKFLEREIVFEVYDPSGKLCAPLESGLPFLFSTPNEQRYLDRDAFDMYNPVPDCNMEHYYACSAMTGDIGLEKRIWETNKLFARKWYVWDSDHRTLTKKEFEDFGDEIYRHSDYCHYPAPSEWAVMRHDPIWTAGVNTRGGMKHLKEFLKLNPQFNVIGVTDETERLSQSQINELLKVCMKEWVEYANKAVGEEVAAQNIEFRKINPDVKRACYGPFPIYYGPMTTHHGINYIGTNYSDYLETELFDGFVQLEDYPYSCAYNTYKGAGFVMHTLLHHPNLVIYPEEYPSSRGGCIDGAVKDAHPPLGKYDMQEYFNVTHSYEYAYNTAYLAENGFKYWNTYGFMQRDFTESFVDAFVKGWKNVVSHKPAKPLRSVAFLSEVSLEEDKWIVSGIGEWASNRSNVGLSYMYEIARTCGIPNGFAVSEKSLMQLNKDMTDLIVIPSMKYLSNAAAVKIRELYEDGVSLLAVGDVSGLEDIFGVKHYPTQKTVFKLHSDDGFVEDIYPDNAEFLYATDKDSNVILWAEDSAAERYPVIIRNGNACLINASIDTVGHRSYENHPLFISKNISPLFRQVSSQLMRELSDPIAVSDNGGLTLFEDSNGDTLMLIINYSDYNLASPDRTWRSTIQINSDKYSGVEVLYGATPSVLKKDAILKGISIHLHQQECALLKLIGRQ